MTAKIGDAMPIAHRTHVSHDAVAPCDYRGFGCGRHELLYEENASAAARRCQRSRHHGTKFASDLSPRYRAVVTYKVNLIYFRQTGKFLATGQTTIAHDTLVEIWKEIDEMRRMGRLPGLRPGAGRDLLIVVDVPDHPKRVMHLVMPPFLDDDDVTPARISTTEMVPLVRVPLAEVPRTSTRDVVKPPEVDQEADTVVGSEDITPVEVPIPKPPDESSR